MRHSLLRHGAPFVFTLLINRPFSWIHSSNHRVSEEKPLPFFRDQYIILLLKISLNYPELLAEVSSLAPSREVFEYYAKNGNYYSKKLSWTIQIPRKLLAKAFSASSESQPIDEIWNAHWGCSPNNAYPSKLVSYVSNAEVGLTVTKCAGNRADEEITSIRKKIENNWRIIAVF